MNIISPEVSLIANFRRASVGLLFSHPALPFFALKVGRMWDAYSITTEKSVSFAFTSKHLMSSLIVTCNIYFFFVPPLNFLRYSYKKKYCLLASKIKQFDTKERNTLPVFKAEYINVKCFICIYLGVHISETN